MKYKGKDGKIIDVPKGAYKAIFQPLGYEPIEDTVKKAKQKKKDGE